MHRIALHWCPCVCCATSELRGALFGASNFSAQLLGSCERARRKAVNQPAPGGCGRGAFLRAVHTKLKLSARQKFLLARKSQHQSAREREREERAKLSSSLWPFGSFDRRNLRAMLSRLRCDELNRRRSAPKDGRPAGRPVASSGARALARSLARTSSEWARKWPLGIHLTPALFAFRFHFFISNFPFFALFARRPLVCLAGQPASHLLDRSNQLKTARRAAWQTVSRTRPTTHVGAKQSAWVVQRRERPMNYCDANWPPAPFGCVGDERLGLVGNPVGWSDKSQAELGRENFSAETLSKLVHVASNSALSLLLARSLSGGLRIGSPGHRISSLAKKSKPTAKKLIEKVAGQ